MGEKYTKFWEASPERGRFAFVRIQILKIIFTKAYELYQTIMNDKEKIWKNDFIITYIIIFFMKVRSHYLILNIIYIFLFILFFKSRPYEQIGMFFSFLYILVQQRSMMGWKLKEGYSFRTYKMDHESFWCPAVYPGIFMETLKEGQQDVVLMLSPLNNRIEQTYITSSLETKGLIVTPVCCYW